jgi:epsilon-lactone hydrolase
MSLQARRETKNNMPSFSANLVGFILRTTGVYRRMFSAGPGMEKALAKMRASPPQPKAKQRAKAEMRTETFRGRPVWHITPKDRAPTATVLYWHGGGYVYPAMDGHWEFFSEMAATHGWRIIAPMYPLAPESEVQEITGFALDFYKDVIAHEDPATLTMAGDSAGAGLTAATAMLARDGGHPLPARLILISPWLNADPSHPDQPAIETRDAILTLGGIEHAGLSYARDLPITDPRVSPIHGNWAGLPPILAFGGGNDILVTDARALKAKHPSVDYTELAGMIHDWPIFVFPESRKAQMQMAHFTRKVSA